MTQLDIQQADKIWVEVNYNCQNKKIIEKKWVSVESLIDYLDGIRKNKYFSDKGRLIQLQQELKGD